MLNIGPSPYMTAQCLHTGEIKLQKEIRTYTKCSTLTYINFVYTYLYIALAEFNLFKPSSIVNPLHEYCKQNV